MEADLVPWYKLEASLEFPSISPVAQATSIPPLSIGKPTLTDDSVNPEFGTEKLVDSIVTKQEAAAGTMHQLENEQSFSLLEDMGTDFMQWGTTAGLFDEISLLEDHYDPYEVSSAVPGSPEVTGHGSMSPEHVMYDANVKLSSLPSPPEDIDQDANEDFNEQFASIMDSLPADQVAWDLQELMSTAGIDLALLNALEMDANGTVSESPMEDSYADAEEDTTTEGDEDESSSSSDESSCINEEDLRDMGIDMDEQMVVEVIDGDHCNDKALDALIAGDLAAAKTYVEPPVLRIIPSKSASAKIQIVTDTNKNKMSGRRSRKSTLGRTMSKAERKKEQNKTAATRYRQKKKNEMAVTSVTEEALAEENAKLTESKNKLHSQILFVKQLLRDMVNNKRSSSTVSIATTVPSLTTVKIAKGAAKRKI